MGIELPGEDIHVVGPAIVECGEDAPFLHEGGEDGQSQSVELLEEVGTPNPGVRLVRRRESAVGQSCGHRRGRRVISAHHPYGTWAIGVAPDGQ